MFNFNIETDSKGNMVLRDYSNIQSKFPSVIDSFKMYVMSSRIDGGLSGEFDVLNYMSLHREDNELYVLKPIELGVNEDVFLDGVYTFRLVINNTEVYQLKLVYLWGLNDKMELVLEKVDTAIDVDELFIDTPSTELSMEMIKYLYTTSVYFKLLFATNETGNENEDEVNDLIDKLNRLVSLL